MDTDLGKKNDKHKTTNEKPISLYPLTFDEAVRELLTVKPPPKDDDEKPRKKRREAKNSK